MKKGGAPAQQAVTGEILTIDSQKGLKSLWSVSQKSFKSLSKVSQMSLKSLSKASQKSLKSLTKVSQKPLINLLKVSQKSLSLKSIVCQSGSLSDKVTFWAVLDS